MSTWNDTIAYIKEQLKPGFNNRTSVQRLLDSLMAIINQINGGTLEPINESLWDPAVNYPANTVPVFWRDQWLVSNIDNNLATEPINESGQTHGSWRIVSSSTGPLGPYEVKVYIQPLEIVFKDGKLYYLDRAIVGTGPFSSLDFAAELTAGQWKPIAGGDTETAHSHANMAILDALSVVDGKLAYNGVPIDTVNQAGVGVFAPVADLAALKALNTTTAADWPDQWLIHAETLGIYALDRESSAAADDNLVIAPTTGVGRWIKKNVGAAAGKIRHDTYNTLTLASTIAWDVTNVADGKAKTIFPNASAVAAIAFSFLNISNGFTGIYRVINDDTVVHSVSFPAEFVKGAGLTNPIEIPSTQLLELNFAFDGVKVAVVGGLFV